MIFSYLNHQFSEWRLVQDITSTNVLKLEGEGDIPILQEQFIEVVNLKNLDNS